MEPTMHGYGCVFTRKTLTDRRKFPRRTCQSSPHLRHQLPPNMLHKHRLITVVAIQLARQMATQIRSGGLGMMTTAVGGLPAPKSPKAVGMAGSITKKSQRPSNRTHALCAKAQARSPTLNSNSRLSRRMLMYGRIFFVLVVAMILRWPTSLHSLRVHPGAIQRP